MSELRKGQRLQLKGSSAEAANLRYVQPLHASEHAADAPTLKQLQEGARKQLLTTREEERRRLRRDLHDGLGPQFAILTMTAEAAHDLVTVDPARAREMLEVLAKQAQAVMADMRSLVYALCPPALDALGLVGAFRLQVPHEDHCGLRISIGVTEELPALPTAVEVAAYRIVLEALNNVLRHAGARNCTVRLGVDCGALCLEVEDDGRGIEENPKAGVGLTSMHERAEEFGGSFLIETASSGGTRVQILLPYLDRNVTGSDARKPDFRET